MPEFRHTGFARLFSDSREALGRYVRRLVRTPGAAEEIVQETYVRAFAQGNLRDPPQPYLFAIARNLASKVRRHDRVVDTVALEAAGEGEESRSPEEEVLADERLRLLNEAIQSLPPQCRAAFTLRMFQDRSYKEIAAQLGISARTVEKHIALGATRVHAAIARRYMEVKTP